MSVADLAAQTAASAGPTRTDPNIYLRAIAILTIVVHHLSGWGIRGASLVLMAMVGFNLARFQSQALFRGDLRSVWSSLRKNLVLYYGVLLFWVVSYWLAGYTIQWPEMLLVSNIIASGGPLVAFNAYWFVEAYVQITLVVIAVCAFPPLRRLISTKPLLFGGCAQVVGVALAHAWRTTWTQPWNACSQRECFPVTEVSFWAAIGWSLYFAQTLRAKIGILILSAGAAIGYSGVYGGLHLVFVPVVIVLSLLTWNAQIPLGSFLHRILSYIAINSYVLYLVHLIPIVVLHHLGLELDRDGILPRVASIAVGLAFSLAVAAVVEKARALSFPWYPAPRGS